MAVQQARVPVLGSDGRFPDAYAPPSVAANTVAAQEAREGAETARTGAITAQGKAEDAQQGAEQALAGVPAAVDGALAPQVQAATDAAVAAQGSAEAAVGSASTATTAAETATTMAGQTMALQDAAVKSLIADEDSETRTELNAVIGEVATPLIEAGSAPFIDDVRPESALFEWHSKLLNAANERADVLMVGDSLWEDYGVTDPAKRRGILLRDRLRTAYPSGADGGLGYVPARYNYSTTTFVRPEWTYAGGSTQNQASGLGLRGKQMFPSRTATITTTLTSFWLLFDKWSTDTWEIRVDGTLVATYTPPNEGSVAADRCTVWKSGQFPTGAHTVEVKSTAGGGVFAGGYFYNGDETKGVHYWDGSYSGALASTYTGLSSDPVQSGRWADFIKADRVNPHLVCVGTLVNDCSAKTAAQYKTDMQALITLIRSKTSSPILLMPHWEPTDRTALSPWADYLTALHELAEENTKTVFFNMTARVPRQTGDPNAMLYDLVHLNTKGQSVKASLEYLALIPR